VSALVGQLAYRRHHARSPNLGPQGGAPSDRGPEGVTVTENADPRFSFPILRKEPLAIPDAYAQLRRECPVAKVRLPSGRSAWAISRYEDVRRVLGDTNFSSDRFDLDFRP
jgi:cytochrome P450